MSEETIFFNCNYQMGDTINPIVFPNSVFIGLSLKIPIRLRKKIEKEPISFIFKTSEMQTWADWQAHKIFLNDYEIGSLKDPNDEAGDPESHEIPISEEIINKIDFNKPLILQIEVGRKTPGLADDFVLTAIASKGAIFSVGW